MSLNSVEFDVKQLSMKLSFTKLSPSDNYCMSLKIHVNYGSIVFVTHSTRKLALNVKMKKIVFTMNSGFSISTL